MGGIFAKVLLLYYPLSKLSEKKKYSILSIYAHNPEKVLFEKTIKWFLNYGYTFIKVESLIEILTRKKSAEKKIWLSFDDGWMGNYENVIPVLEKYKVPATFFVSTQLIRDGYFWLKIARENNKLINISPNKLKIMPERERRSIVKNLLVKSDGKYRKRYFMTMEQIKEIANNPLFAIGNHTHHHVITTNCSERELKEELKLSNNILKELLKKDVKIFAYPNGNYNSSVKQILKENGFILCAGTEPRCITQEDDLLELPRCGLLDKGTLSENICHSFGIWQPAIKKLNEYFS
jgi:peptidoglycan/xylan/chitin deacetylase (PgdA/CDA1 family)